MVICHVRMGKVISHFGIGVIICCARIGMAISHVGIERLFIVLASVWLFIEFELVRLFSGVVACHVAV